MRSGERNPAMRLTGRPEGPDDRGAQVERLREAVEILHRVTGITDRAFREAVVEGYILLPPQLRDRVTTTVSPAVHADYLRRIAELSAQAERLREWAARLPEAGVTVPEPQPLDPARLLARMRRPGAGTGAPAPGVPPARSWAPPLAVPAPPPEATPAPPPEATPAPPPAPAAAAPAAPVAPASPPAPGSLRASLRARPRTLAAAGTLVAVAAAVTTGVALLRPGPAPSPARDTAASTVPVAAPTLPPPRRGEAVAAGPGSQVTVLFGGVDAGGALLDDTWAFDGHRWSELRPGTAPAARAGALSAYDGVRHQLVLTGGRGATGTLTDTWTWDGVGWTAQLPETPPRTLSWSAMAADAGSGTVVLVTGRSGAPAQTWLWDGRNWTRAEPAVEPLLGAPPVMSADPLTGHVLLLTAAGAGSSPAATWLWDGRAWGPRPQPQPPVVRPGATWMAADRVARRVLLFTTGTAGGATWLWNGSRWSYVFSPVAPAIAADGVASGVVTDPVSGRPVLVGAGAGGDPSRFRGDWTWLGDRWRAG
jgi:hypothetical protein